MYPYGPPHMANQKQDGQLEHSYSSYLMIQDVTLLAARHDDDDDDDDIFHYILICAYIICQPGWNLISWTFPSESLFPPSRDTFWYDLVYLFNGVSIFIDNLKPREIMEFGIEKCAMLVMKSGKRHMTDGIELPNHDRIRTLEEKETYKYLGIFEADTIKQVEIKDTIRKEYLRRMRKLLETKLSSRNLIKGINTWAVPLVRYSGPFLKWTREELKQMDWRTRKVMTMHKALHPRDDVDRLYVSRKEGGRGLASIEDTVDAFIQRLKDYIQ